MIKHQPGIRKEYVVIHSTGKDIRRASVRLRLYLRIIGPKRTEFDAWVAGFRLFSLFVFLHRYAWGQMRLSVEWRGRVRRSAYERLFGLPLRGDQTLPGYDLFIPLEVTKRPGRDETVHEKALRRAAYIQPVS